MVPADGRVLAVDLGRRRIGLAVSDALGLTTRPLPNLTAAGRRQDLAQVAAISRQQQVVRVVVGLPLEMAGTEGEAARVARNFAGSLRALLSGVEVVLCDERLTTVEAERDLIDAGVRREQRRDRIDGLAAARILESYLAQRASPTEG